MLALAFCSSLFLVQAHTPENEKNPFGADNAAAIAAGRKTHSQVCQGCHDGGRAPALSAASLKHGSSDGQIFQNIRGGIAGTQMPPFAALKADQIWQLVSFIKSVGGVSAEAAGPGNPQSGEALFFGKANCASCHGIHARGGLVGPDLSSSGRMPASVLRRKIEQPSAILPGQRREPGTIVVTTSEGAEIRGVRVAEDSFQLRLMDATGKLWDFDKSTLAGARREQGSLMPAVPLSPAELNDLVAYLKTNTARDLAKAAAAPLDGGLSFERIRDSASEPHNWLTYWGDYAGTHFSALDAIKTSNVGSLRAAWAAQLPGASILESTPIVIDGLMYVSGSPGEVFALDARTGQRIWRHQRSVKKKNPYESNPFNRGVAVLGNRVFYGTLDAALVALDARTGAMLWETQVADTMLGYSITVAPLALKDKVIVGLAGGEYGVRGMLDAYDAKTGKRLWRFYTTPGPGEPGNDTWPGDTWKRGGGLTWLTGSYDPELDTLYWTTGNPSPGINAEVRKGDNLYTCSVLALDPNTGKRKWHYQFTPGDSHDWDSNQAVILVDREYNGRRRKLLLHPDRNGMYYVLDRVTGQFLSATAYVRQTWNSGFDPEGRPIWRPDSHASAKGAVVYPSLVGGTNWQSPSYDPGRGWLFLMTEDSGQLYISNQEVQEPGKQYWSGRVNPAGGPGISAIKALDAVTGAEQWRFPVAQGSLAAGVLATRGGVLFAGTREGHLIALDSATGGPLWRFQTGGVIASSPMSYAVDGKQFIAVTSGNVLYAFALPE